MIFFDAGGTLVRADWRRVAADLAQVAASHQMPVSQQAVYASFREVWRDVITGKITDTAANPAAVQHFWHQVLSTVLLRAANGVEPEHERQAVAAAAEFYPQFDGGAYHHLFDEAIETLEALSAAGYRLGLLSNWSPSLPKVLHRLDLRRFFEIIVVSSLVGLAKPDPDIFHLTAARARCRPDQLLYVGDSPAADIAGSRAAGWDSILIARRDPTRHGDIDIPRQIESLRELIEILVP